MIKNDRHLQDTRLILSSSLGQHGDARRFEAIGFSGYLVKPIRHTDLYDLIVSRLAARAGDPAGSSQSDRTIPIAPHHSAHEIRRVPAGVTGRILLVEDNLINQKVMLGILKKIGLNQADVTANGAEAIQALANTPYDLVLMDVQMPVMDGYETTRRIRDAQSAVLNHAIPIIATTAHALHGDRDRCLAAGMNDYLAKPIDPQTLSELIIRWLAVKRKDAAETQTASSNPSAADIAAKPTQAEVPPQNLAVFNRTILLDRVMDDAELARDVLEAFLVDIPRQIHLLKNCVQAGDLNGCGRRAHSIKGAAANIGAERLRATAFELENLSKAGDATTLQPLVVLLETQFESLTVEIRKDLPAA
jgi:CheY-like chemotaxis protein